MKLIKEPIMSNEKLSQAIHQFPSFDQITDTMETLHAIKGSMNKWWEIAFFNGSDCGRWNCPLCAKFFGSECAGCPIATIARAPYCRNTPYNRWKQATASWGSGRTIASAADPEMARAAALEEFKFLKKLRDDYLRWWMFTEINDAAPGRSHYPSATALAEAAIDHFTSDFGELPWDDLELPYRIAAEFIKEIN